MIMRTDLTKNRYHIEKAMDMVAYGDEMLEMMCYKIYDSVKGEYIWEKPYANFEYKECYEKCLDLNYEDWQLRKHDYDYHNKLEYWADRLQEYLASNEMENVARAIKKLRYFGEMQLNLDMKRAICFECLEDRDDCPSGRCTE